VGGDDPSLAPLKALYSTHGGDLTAIFAELGDDPGKAIKYPPKDADEFATKVCDVVLAFGGWAGGFDDA